jgi:MYXO-CTERM domain-containing protein
MVYDSDRDRMVLFGTASLTNTWEYDGVAWAPRPALFGSDLRAEGAMVYDQARRRVVLFGGHIYNYGYYFYNDTWEYHLRGGNCSTGADCDTGYCVDGTCCEMAACSTCQTCNGTNPGLCTTLTNTQDPDSCTGALHCGPTGQCGTIGGSVCGAPGDCASGYCVNGFCCDGTCDGQCQACNGATLGWPGAVNGICANAPVGMVTFACSPYVCGAGGDCATTCSTDAECASTHFCSADGLCQMRKFQAEPCSPTADCAQPGCRVCLAGSCTDGVCCATPCTGACYSCNAPGSAGTCTPTPVGLPAPHAGCATTDPTTCGSDGTCDGFGSCHLWTVGTECQAASCATSTTQNNPRFCDGLGTCTAPTMSSCGAYACVGSECATSCGSPAECAGSNACASNVCTGGTGCAVNCTADSECCVGSFCVAGVCATSAGPGHACIDGSQCQSGHCADGVCCDAACNGPCVACNLAGKVGTCSPAAAGSSDAQCATTLASTCGTDGKCDGAGACRFYIEGTACSAPTCASAESLTLGRACDGAGVCQSAETRPCGNYACQAGVCRTSCTQPSHCAAGSTCTGGVCVGGAGCQVSCTLDNQCCPGDQCVQGSCHSGTAPTITSTASTQAYVDEPYHYSDTTSDRVTANGGAPITFSYAPALPGATLDAMTGAFAWTPATMGSVTINITAANPWGTATQMPVITVGAARPPSIAHDANLVAMVGSPYLYNASRHVTATGGLTGMSFSKVTGPTDFVVDTSGLVTWTPSVVRAEAVTIQATNAHGSDQYSFVIDAQGTTTLPPPVAVAAADPISGLAVPRLTVRLDSSASTGSIATRQWVFGDGSPPLTITDAASDPHHDYSPGGYVARLHVTDTLGRSATDAVGIQAADSSGVPPPVVQIVADVVEGPAELVVNFHCNCDRANNAKLLWLFGDGGEASDPYPPHHYTKPGTYEVSLYGFDPVSGQTGVDRIQVTVLDGTHRPPTAHAYANPVSSDDGELTVTLTSDVVAGDSPIASYSWTRVDNGSAAPEVLSTEAMVIHTFTDAGTYHIRLEVTDGHGLTAQSNVDLELRKQGVLPPEIISPPSTFAQVGLAYQYGDDLVPHARGTRPLTWGLKKHPPSMTIDGANGTITWIPSAGEGGHDAGVVITASNTAGGTEQEFAVAVAKSPTQGGSCAVAPAAEPTAALPLVLLFVAAAIVRRRARLMYHQGDATCFRDS